MTITVIVCAHNEEAFIVPALLSLLGQARPPDEILVINNASADRTKEVSAAIPGVRVYGPAPDQPRTPTVAFVGQGAGHRARAGTS